ncbi:MAG: hypothetical protein Q8L48_24750 [Archangium sp.]|nr:hypothetical protein [Archangium sp.]
MKRIILLLGALALAAPVALFLTWDTQTRNLGNALLAELTTAKKTLITRTPPPQAPLHDNGYQCVGAMLDVTASDFAPFYGKEKPLEDFITGAKAITDLPEDVRAKMKAFSPWATSLRGCGESMKLSYVEGVAPWAPDTHPRQVRLASAIPALIEFTALELRVLLGDQQPEVALERCSQTWAMVADQSHLGLAGALHARMAVRRLAPACGEALAAVPADVRAQVAKPWASLKNRLATPHELIDLERLKLSLVVFAWVSGDPIRTQLPPAALPVGAPGLKRRLRVGRLWHQWDAAMRKLSSVADAPGAERVSASEAVDATFEGTTDVNAATQYAKFLAASDETAVLLDLFADLAAGGTKPLPAGVTKTGLGLEYDNGQGQKLLIAIPK